MLQRQFSYRYLVGFLIVWVVLFAIWRWYQAPREAQARLASIRHVLAVVTEYVRQHQGVWPRGWEEIEKTPVPPDAPPRQGAWPEVRAHVKVDFGADPRKLLQAGPDQFQAISPKGRCSGDYREDVQRLLEAIRQALPAEATAEKPLASGAGAGPTKPTPGPSSEATKLPPTPKEPPSTLASGSKESISEKPSLPGKLPGLPKEIGEQPPAEKATPAPIDKQPPSPKEKTEPSSKQPPRIVLPGLD